MFSNPSSRRRRALLLASTMIAPTIVLSTARAQQAPAPEQLPAIEITRPGDQNVTRAKPAADEAQTPRRPAPGTAQATIQAAGADRARRGPDRPLERAAPVAAAASSRALSAPPRP